MTPEQLVALIDSYASASYGGEHGQLADERALAIARYNGELYGDERDGRSQLVSTELRDTVETVVPQLMRIFLGGDQICEFDPETEDDVEKAKQESKYVNFIVTQRNPSFQVFGTWFRDALICKNGYVKAWWDERDDIRKETYRGKTDDEFALLLQDPSIEVIAHTAYPDPSFPAPTPMAQGVGMMGQPQGMPPPPPGMQPPLSAPQQPGMQPQQMPMQRSLHDIQIRRVKKTGYVRFDNVPPEEIRVHISTRGPDLRDAIYVEHRTAKTLSEIRQMGYDVPDDWAGTLEDPFSDIEAQARDRFSDLVGFQDDGGDPATRRATFREVWIRVDEDGDGIAELRKICLINRRVLADEDADLIPIACITPVIQPHRHVGYGYYDFLKEIEKATTAMLRSFFDNIYLANNGRYGVDVNKVNVDDMLVSRPGGLVRTQGNPQEAIFPITHPSIGDAAARGMDYLASWKKASTGVVMDSGAISSDVLSNAPASSISQVISVWQARIEGVARCFAETGMTELFRIVHALTSQNATSAERVQLSGQWVTVDPREWTKRTNLTVTVGLGTGSREAKIAFLQNVWGAQGMAMQFGICQPKNMYETAIELMKEGGFKDGSRFWTDPTQVPPPPPQEDPMVQAEKIKADAQMQIAQAKAQADAQIEQARMQADMVVQQHDAETKAQLELEKHRMQMAVDDMRHSREQETQLRIAAMKAQAQVDAAQITATKQAEAGNVPDPESGFGA